MTERTAAGSIAAVTGRGRRRVNQDAVLAVSLPGGGELIAVADGMGGHSAGEVASRIALDVLRSAVEGGADLAAAVQAANAAVFAEAGSQPGREGMGTTLVAVLRRGSQYVVANVGDSRAYRVDADRIRQITADHSFVADAVRSGDLTADEAGSSPWRHAVTRAVGTDRDVEVDCHGPFDTADAHAVVLCTDGLYRSVSDEELARHVRAAEPAAAGRSLAAAAYAAGSDDNISVAVVSFGLAVIHADATQPPPPAEEPAASPTPPAVAPPAADDDPAFRSRRRRGRGRRRWKRVELGAILLALLGVIVYVFVLARMF